MGKNPDLGYGINIPDHISKSLVTIFWVKKILKFFVAGLDPGSNSFLIPDPGSGKEIFGSGIREKHPETATLLTVQYRCVQETPLCTVPTVCLN